MYSILAKNILYPLGDFLLGYKTVKYLNELLETQWWPPKQLQEIQNAKLRSVVRHAYNNVPYYNRIFKQRGLNDRDVETTEDLQKLPVLTKDDIRSNFKDMLATNYAEQKPILNASSGSTGEPLQYYIDKKIIAIS